VKKEETYMRRSGLFWGTALILIGILLLLNTLGILKVNVWGLIWPSILILLGLSALWGAFAGPRQAEVQQAVIPLEGASRAKVRVSFGAGRLAIRSHSSPSELVNGSFEGGLDFKTDRDGDTLKVKMRVPYEDMWAFPWMWWGGRRFEWSVGLSNQIPLDLRVEAGASQSQLDLTDLRVTDLKLEVGASNTEVTMPAGAGNTKADIDAGAATVKIRIPSGVAARIRFSGGAATFTADSSRFPRMGDYYQSPDYEGAPNKIEMRIDAGAGTVDVR